MIQEKIFAEGVAKEIKDYLSEEFSDVECRVMEQEKNNSVSLVGICFHKPGRQADPIIPVEPFYHAIRQGKPKEEVLGKIAGLAEKGMREKEIPKLDDLSEYGKVKEHLVVQLVNTKANREQLLDVPHRDMEDLSLIPALRFPMEEPEDAGFIRVTGEMAERWGVSGEVLFEQALENMEKSKPPVLYDMETLLALQKAENLFADSGSALLEVGGKMYVLTNAQKCYGASVLACPDVMEKISRMFPEGFYILPSSVHELLILPKAPHFVPKGLGEMVQEVNRSQLRREEVLSDRVYEYDKEKGKIFQIMDSIKKERGMER